MVIKMNLNNQNNIMFLEKFIVTINFDCVREIVLKDLYKNIDTIKQRGELPRILGGKNTEREQLELQVSKMIEMNELLNLNNESCHIALLKKEKKKFFLLWN